MAYNPRGVVPAALVTHQRIRKLLPPVARLKVWQCQMAEWLAAQVKRQSKASLIAQASTFAGTAIPRHQVLGLVYQNPHFRAYREALTEDNLKAARYKIKFRAMEAVDAHFDAISWAVGEQDHKNMASLTVPILDRVWPKQEETAPNQLVQIVLTHKQHALIDAPSPEVEYEVVPPPPVGSSSNA